MNPRALVACSVAAGAFFLCRAAPALGGEPDAGDGARERAQELLEKGNALFRAGDFRQALARYREARQGFESPKLFFSMALCEDSLGEGPLALEHFTTFLREAPEAGPALRAHAEARVSALRAQLVLVNLLKVPPDAAVRIDGVTAGKTPLERPIWLLPGPHRFLVEATGRPIWLTSIDGTPGATLTLEMPAPIVSPPPPPPILSHPHAPDDAGPKDQHSTARRYWWLWTGIGVVLIGGATVTYFALRCPATQCQ